MDVFEHGKLSTVVDDEIRSCSIEQLLQKPFNKHIGSFEIPTDLKSILDVDEINAIISWYMSWKLTEPIETQNTCTIKTMFGVFDSVKVIIAINLYKYLRNKGYDPEIIDQFITKMINTK
jgi:hypothetical protein